MFLRRHSRNKNGKVHHYWDVVESRRLAGGATTQRCVLYLGEIDGAQQEAWRRSIEVFDEERQESRELSLFPADEPIAAQRIDALSLRVSEMTLLRPRSFGDCWLGCQLWNQIGLDRFWHEKLLGERGDVPWEKVVQLLAVNRLCDPGSELALHRSWFLNSAMDELLGCDYAVAEKDRLYRCLDRILPHKDELCKFLVERWKTLFDARFDVLLYDLTSTYFEGLCQENPKARHGYSRDNRSDCRQVVIALVVTPDGLPLAYEVLAGNTSDKTTLKAFLAKIEALYGKANRVWVMDRGIPTEATLKQMRADGVAYLVGTPKTSLGKMEEKLVDKPWESVHEGMSVKLLEEDSELYIQAKSSDRQKKETAMRRRKLAGLGRGLHRLKRSVRKGKVRRDHLLKRVAVLKKEAGRIGSFVKVKEPKEGEKVNLDTFSYSFDQEAWNKARERDGSYLLRAHIPFEEWPAGMEKRAAVLWKWYMQLVHVEESFKTLKGDLGLRPVFHQLEHRVEAHIMVAFLGYCLSVSLRMKLRLAAPGLTPRAVLASLCAIKLVEVHIPTTDGRRTLILPRHTQPEPEQEMILETLGLTLPVQPPPRIRQGQVELSPKPPALRRPM
jgi:transposase